MADSRRSQLHSCDPCRKGKRGCDAPKNQKERGNTSCSNCKRWKKECTFHWLSAKCADSTRAQKRARASTAKKAPNPDPPATTVSYRDDVSQLPRTLPWHHSDLGNTGLAMDSPSLTSSSSTESPPGLSNGLPGGFHPRYGQVQLPFSPRIQDVPNMDGLVQPSNLPPGVFQAPFNCTQQPEQEETLSWEFELMDQQEHSPIAKYHQPLPKGLCIASENTASAYARSTMTRNLIRIYHDSMENALSCWLTEHNCPYSSSPVDVLSYGKRKEWGPSWSNRMCIRVCRLDRASSPLRGRGLSVDEDRAAARALHLSIMAFASQWTQHAQSGIGLSVPAPIARDERSIRQYVWNEARHALEHSTGIPSFRVIFANIIFSLTQSPLDREGDTGLGRLLENDRSPVFLEAANRQLFTFRHKYARLKRQAPVNHRPGSVRSQTPDSLHVDPILASQEHRSTLSLLFWLGVMFDTLSAAMYQRPLVVSDEDSQIASASPSLRDLGNQIDLRSTARDNGSIQPDIWGDFFLQGPDRPHERGEAQPRWPCSNEEAASVLSKATPVKVLLYRRVTQLQTLVYRGASGDRLEEVIQKTLRVYQHWNRTYRGFMLDCVAHHEMLPPRIQSWYVILDGHWHLAAMLLADAIGDIDDGRLGSDAEREARESTDFVSSLKTDNAFAVGALARSSLRGQDPNMYGHFHDSLNEVAFLVEPWTVVLIHSFAKAGLISLERLDCPGEFNGILEPFRQNCEFCIQALRYLGRKSDMAFLVGENLAKSLDLKLRKGDGTG